MATQTVPSPAVLEVRRVSQWFPGKDGQRVRVLHNVHLDLGKGEVASIVGPSGCGKSTLLHAIMATQPQKDGDILVLGQPVHRPGPDRGIVYQEYSLFPFLTALENVTLGLTLRNLSIAERLLLPLSPWRLPEMVRLRRQFRDRAAQVLEQVGMKDHMGKLPRHLSGGQRQRVAFAQAVIMQPAVLLLDEPLGALDSTTRQRMQVFILELVDLFHPSVLFVTHDVEEALYVGDRVIGLSQFWDHQGDGQHPGATIVYDKPAPKYDPGDVRRTAEFAAQVREIQELVYEPRVKLCTAGLANHIVRRR